MHPMFANQILELQAEERLNQGKVLGVAQTMLGSRLKVGFVVELIRWSLVPISH